MDCNITGFPVHHQLPEPTRTHVQYHAIQPFILCHPLLLLPSIFPNIKIFSNELVLCITWPKYWSFSFSISPSNEYSGLISFSMDWLGLLAVQGTLKSLLQHHSSKASILQGFPCGSAGKESACNERDLGLIPGLGRSPREGKAIHSSVLD